MIGTNCALGNLPLRRRAARGAAAAIFTLLLGGCADIFYATVGALGAARGVATHAGLVYDPGHGLALDVYAPRDGIAAPVVVFFYGGSWQGGKRRWFRYVGDALASNGVVAMIPDYRKFPDVRFPAFMHDAARAVVWAREHAHEFGGDPSRIFVMGHSAGGQIAALLAADPRYLDGVGMAPRQLGGMIGLAGAYAFLPFVDDEARIFGDNESGRYDSQPINFVNGDEPPMLLLQGSDDNEVPPRNAEVMAERAQAMDGTAVLKVYPGIGHASILLSFARGRVGTVPALRDTLDFIAHPPARAAPSG